MSWAHIYSLSDQLGQKLLASEQTIATAESCTGGGLGYALTAIAGSSQWYLGGVNAYANQLKQDLLAVDSEFIAEQGAVSEPVVARMAAGAIERLGADIAISTSGIAGPDGGTADKPVGTVCFGCAIGEQLYTATQHFSGDRESVRLQSIEFALTYLLEQL